MAIAWIPSRVTVQTVAALAGASLVALVLGADVSLVGSVAAAALLAGLVHVLLDARRTRRAWDTAPLQWRRRLPAAFALGVRHALAGRLVNEGAQAWQIEFFDHPDPGLQHEGLPIVLMVPAGAAIELQYAVTPSRRGPVRFAPAELRVKSLGGSLQWRRRVGDEALLRVYPNFAAVSRYAWLASDRRLAQIGIKSAPQRGSGTDFKQLGEYASGDSIRHIDWKATLKLGRPIVREFQDERDQCVIFLLDCGRRMRADEGMAAAAAPGQRRIGSHFDEALNALMLLAYVALKEGDEVGALTFGTDAADRRLFAPRKGQATLNALMATLYDIEPQATHSDYLMAARDLMTAHRKRALVVVLTNFRDEDAAELMPALSLLRSRHLVMLASLRERVLRELAEQAIATDRQAVEAAAAHLFMQSRRDAFAKLAGRDGLLLDVEPAQLAAELVNRYHAVKRAGML